MTQIFEFIVGKINQTLQFALDLKFEFYGMQVSLLEIEIALLMLGAVIRLFLFGFNGDEGILAYKGQENKKDKALQKEYIPKHGKNVYVPRHAEYEPRHAKKE